MKPLIVYAGRIAGFTLPEVLIGAAVASIVLGGMMTGSVVLQRSFSASDRLARSHADLIRVADYMSRDIRNATSIDATASASVLLTVTLADYYDRRGTPGNLTDDIPNNPTLGRTLATYGGNPVTIRYLRSGTRVGREVSRTDAGATTTSTAWIADNVDNFTLTLDAKRTATIASASAMRYGRRKAGTQSPSLSFVMVSQPRNPAL